MLHLPARQLGRCAAHMVTYNNCSCASRRICNISVPALHLFGVLCYKSCQMLLVFSRARSCIGLSACLYVGHDELMHGDSWWGVRQPTPGGLSIVRLIGGWCYTACNSWSWQAVRMVCPVLDWFVMGRSAIQVSVKNIPGLMTNLVRREPQDTAGDFDKAIFMWQAAACAMLALFCTGASLSYQALVHMPVGGLKW